MCWFKKCDVWRQFETECWKGFKIRQLWKNAQQADNVDYRHFIDFTEFKGVAQKLDKLDKKFTDFQNTNLKDKTLDAFLNHVKKLKRGATLKNIGACIGVLGVLAPMIMVMARKFGKNNSEFQVKEDLRKELSNAQ